MEEEDLSPPGSKLEKSSSTPSDFEVFDYEDIREVPEVEVGARGGHRVFDRPTYHRRLGTQSSDDEPDACGTPLNLELAQLLTQGIVTKAKANFGISKNIETLERSTIELERELHASSSEEQVPYSMPSSFTHSSSSGYKRDPDLFLRRTDDILPVSGGAPQQEAPDDEEEDVDYVQLKTEQLKQSREQQEFFDHNDQLGQFFEDDELVFETHTPQGGYTPSGSGVGAGASFRYTEPTTSYHSACGGYDSERMMFEGTCGDLARESSDRKLWKALSFSNASGYSAAL
uniref:Uncharacterized protein n=1 Tax=Anopheles atroparvus TaxID=41427 RepID=A0A182IRK2_ANOAO